MSACLKHTVSQFQKENVKEIKFLTIKYLIADIHRPESEDEPVMAFLY